jgi:biotin carboxyl carrier protein
MIVWDGHDLLAHHRRWDYLFEPIRAFGFTSNAARYSYDFVPVDAGGAMSRGDESNNASWLGFRAPVHAPGPGTVVVAVDDQPDNRDFNTDDLKKDLMVMYGNRIVIDHGNGEHSVLAHLAQRSAKVKVGDTVRSGQVIAAIGASGSAFFPHLHYQLQTSPTGAAEGLPSYFHAFARIRGSRRTPVASGQVDSGEIIESSAK